MKCQHYVLINRFELERRVKAFVKRGE